MKSIYLQTLKRLFRPLNMIIYYLVMLVASVGVSLFLRYGISNGEMNLQGMVISTKALIYILAFVWLTGMPFIVNLVAHGTGLFATEEYEGTMVLLVSKPVSRTQIVSGKLLALITSCLFHQAAALILTYSVISAFSGVDPDVLTMLLSVFPGIMLYGLFVTLFFTSIAGAMSTIFRKKVGAIVISLVFVFITFAVFPIVRSVLQSFDIYEKYFIYIFDVNYHFGTVFNSAVGLFTSVAMPREILSILGAFTGTYVPVSVDPDISALDVNSFRNSYAQADFINIIVLLAVYSAVMVVLYFFTYRRMNRKDIS